MQEVILVSILIKKRKILICTFNTLFKVMKLWSMQEVILASILIKKHKILINLIVCLKSCRVFLCIKIVIILGK